MISLYSTIDTGEIQAATCTISDRATFLRYIMAVSRDLNVHIICFDADKLAGIDHVRAAVAHAVRSYSSGNQIANTLEMEALLYAAGSRQTTVGSSFGVHAGENRMYVCCYPGRKDVWERLSLIMRFCAERDPWDTIDEQKAADLVKLFDIPPEELATLTTQTLRNLVLERVALLDVTR